VADVALGVIAAVAGVGVPVELLARVGDVEGRVTFGIEVLALFDLHRGILLEELVVGLGRLVVGVQRVGEGGIGGLGILSMYGDHRDGR
jgi:hypothetical protein